MDGVGVLEYVQNIERGVEGGATLCCWGLVTEYTGLIGECTNTV